MKKICKVCNGEFTTTTPRIYCSSQCQKEASQGVFLPEIGKIYKHQLTDVNGKYWHYKC